MRGLPRDRPRLMANGARPPGFEGAQRIERFGRLLVIERQGRYVSGALGNDVTSDPGGMQEEMQC